MEDIVFYTKRWDRYKKFPAGYIVPTGNVWDTANNDYLYSAQSIRRISPFLASVSCIANAAGIQWGVCPLEDIFT